MDAIGVKRPTVDPHATAYVADMVALVEQLVDRGSAYVTSDGVYLSVETVEDYGLLAHQSLEDMRAGGGERSLVGEEKRSTRRLRALEAREARRAVLGVAVGRGPARLAHRVRRDVARPSR